MVLVFSAGAAGTERPPRILAWADDDLYLLNERAIAMMLHGLDNFAPCAAVEHHRQLLLARQARLSELAKNSGPLRRVRMVGMGPASGRRR